MQNSHTQMEIYYSCNSFGAHGIMVSEPCRVVYAGMDFILGLVHSPGFRLLDCLYVFCDLSQVKEGMTVK